MVTTLLALAALPRLARLVTVPIRMVFSGSGEVVQTLPRVDPEMPFDEAIVSWNVDHFERAALKVEARAVIAGRMTKWYTMGDWSGDARLQPRVSVDHQADADGNVLTDTLSLKSPAEALEVRLTGRQLAAGAPPAVRFLAVSFVKKTEPVPDIALRSEAWGKVVDVPQRAQGNYPNGGVLCSATSVSMLLDHYSKVLHRPELDHDVPDVQANVWDTVYKGAGNWPFNTAFAGSQPGMKGYVTRLTRIADLEKWIAAGFPVACSVSNDMLNGRPLSATEQGHLVVLVGFTATGDPVFNDPAHRDQVRRHYARADFERAWNYSKRTVYLIYPEDASVPSAADGLWAEPKNADR